MLTLLIAIVIALGLWGCDFPIATPCGDTIKREVKSPDGNYVATVFERDCGATSAFITYVNLREISAKFDSKSEEGIVFEIKEDPKINLVWTDESNLHIECSECKDKRIYTQEESWKNIQISY